MGRLLQSDPGSLPCPSQTPHLQGRGRRRRRRRRAKLRNKKLCLESAVAEGLQVIPHLDFLCPSARYRSGEVDESVFRPFFASINNHNGRGKYPAWDFPIGSLMVGKNSHSVTGNSLSGISCQPYCAARFLCGVLGWSAKLWLDNASLSIFYLHDLTLQSYQHRRRVRKDRQLQTHSFIYLVE